MHVKKFIREYAQYNIWANQLICRVIASLSKEQIMKEIPSSFSSIQKTLLHIWDAQLIWINRLEGVSVTAYPSATFAGTREEMLEGVISTSKKLQKIVSLLDKNDLKSVKKYATMTGGIVTSSQYQVLAHIFNHSTYHRGQLVTLLRTAGVTELPKTDLIFFYRENPVKS